MEKLKIVIVSANCHPFLSPRAHRSTELAKELSKRGYNVHLYSLLGNYDYSKIAERTGITFKNLGNSRFGLQDNTQNRNRNIIYRAFARFLGKFFAFPYIELTYLVKKQISKEKDIDVLITIAHPHSIHWAILLLKKKNYKCWIADCGDPFMGDPFNFHPFYFKYVEKKWCKKVDFITIPFEKGKSGYYPEFRDKIKVIPQGFNFDEVKLAKYEVNSIPTFAYSGTIYENKRDPLKFLEYLSILKFDFKFIVYTKSKKYFERYRLDLGDKLQIKDYIPRTELIYELSKMDFLINIKNNSEVQLPSKLIDYYLSGRPILEIATSFDEQQNFESFIKRDYTSQLFKQDVSNYDIKNVTSNFINLFWKCI
ncbi:MAG TPA: hypothetical protein DEG28_13240 [Porphyromonadaceae bacterium]|jgi:hypothetical protein|nr:hypothetical protein [Porphyromonadaceae bacterium]